MTLKNIGTVHKAKSDFQETLSFYEKAATIRREVLPPSHPDIVRMEQDIRDISSKLK